jgi:AraC-like DNA-binding protein
MEVCFESGFNNLSYFNRQFRKLMNRTPMEYRKTIKP